MPDSSTTTTASPMLASTASNRWRSDSRAIAASCISMERAWRSSLVVFSSSTVACNSSLTVSSSSLLAWSSSLSVSTSSVAAWTSSLRTSSSSLSARSFAMVPVSSRLAASTSSLAAERRRASVPASSASRRERSRSVTSVATRATRVPSFSSDGRGSGLAMISTTRRVSAGSVSAVTVVGSPGCPANARSSVRRKTADGKCWARWMKSRSIALLWIPKIRRAAALIDWMS